jgi:uncharacterized protein (DUF362 family)/Pyruvate/2-oxoacid:ferredoxin oxidoreductase delta subunit
MAIVFAKQSSYDYGRLSRDVMDIISRLEEGADKPDGTTGRRPPRIEKGRKVLIKPNLLSASSEEQAITTHPLIIKATVQYVLEKGGKPLVADSPPPVGSFGKLISKCGIIKALDGMPVEVAELSSSRRVPSDGRWKHLELAGEALDADVIINLPKLKTHCQMGLTLGVKNLFGCVVGARKPEWHYRIGERREIFAELLVSIYKTLRPSINLIDGILALEGEGPGSGGTPRYLGVLIGSDSAAALDVAVCRVLGFEPLSLLTNRVAEDMGLLEEAEISGDLPEVRDFRMPETRDMLFGPAFTHGFLRHHIASRPVAVEGICKLCGECLKICPADAISNHGKGKPPAFDYERCIRCYCCLEVCPHKAMRRYDTLMRKLLKILFRSS